MLIMVLQHEVIKYSIACRYQLPYHIYLTMLMILLVTIYVTLFYFQVEVMNKADKSQKTETAFRLFDKNKDGYITREEFNKVDASSELKPIYSIVNATLQVSKKLNGKQIEAVFAKFDANGDGRLSMEEFRQMMEKKQ